MPISFQFDVRTFVWIGPVYIGCTYWPNSLVCSSRKGRTPFSACVSSARHLIEAQYDWGNVCSISVRSFLWYSFDQLAWVAPVDGHLAWVAPVGGPA